MREKFAFDMRNVLESRFLTSAVYSLDESKLGDFDKSGADVFMLNR